MSHQRVSRSPDLKKLRDEGYEIEIRSGYLLVHSVPYVNAKKEVQFATLASELTLAGDVTTRPKNHITLFTGDHPCHRDGTEITQIKHSASTQALGDGLIARHSFSNKPPDGYGDYHEKMTRYIEIISAPAKTLTDVDARTFKAIPENGDDAVFQYVDTASSRAGIIAVSEKLRIPNIALVGLGGTGSYVLDLVAKTPTLEIHLYDGDTFLQHNAFRAPGAASLEELQQRPKKVDYFAALYSRLHRHIIPHAYHITDANVNELRNASFVFLCMDRGRAKRAIIETLQNGNIPFIDVGMGVELAGDALVGILRVTTSTNNRSDHIPKRISLSEQEKDEYDENIQIADLNALNAALAVIKWKKLVGFYQDCEHEHHSTYSVNVNLLTSDDVA